MLTPARRVYLRPNAVAEPLYNQWHAWPLLVSPLTAPMYVRNLHLRLMESFVADPALHVAARRNAETAGGPFLDLDEGKILSVTRLLEKTRRRSARLIRFADAVHDLSRILSELSDGSSLEPLYAQVPEPLKGFVELVYDVNHRPAIRFLEPLLYRSAAYDESAQGFHLSVIGGDDRPFAFGAPRLEEGERLGVSLPYRADGLDSVFAMRERSEPLGLAKEALELNGSVDGRFERLFTDLAPPPRSPHDGPGVRLRYFGHACVLIETRGTSILIDPVIGYDHGNGMGRFSFADLPERIDYVLITHGHRDHCVLETLLQIRHKVGHVIVPRNGGGTLADPSLRMILESSGFRRVWEIDELGLVETDDGSIMSIPLLGGHAELNIRSKTSYLVRLLGKSFLFCADSNGLEPRLYDHLGELVGELDAAFIGLDGDGAPMSWLYGPLMTIAPGARPDRPRRLDASDDERVLELVRRLRPRSVYLYAMGSEPWLTHLISHQNGEPSRPARSRALVRQCLAMGICAESLFGKRELQVG